MLSEIDKYTLNRCKKDKKFAKYCAYYDQALDTAILVFELREKLHLTQQELANKANIPRSTVAKIENGNMNPTIALMYRIVNACNSKFHMSISINSCLINYKIT